MVLAFDLCHSGVLTWSAPLDDSSHGELAGLGHDAVAVFHFLCQAVVRCVYTTCLLSSDRYLASVLLTILLGLVSQCSSGKELLIFFYTLKSGKNVHSGGKHSVCFSSNK